MKNDHKEILVNVFDDVLEKFAFMFGEEIEKDAIKDTIDEYNSDLVEAEMSFSGPVNGELSLAVPIDMCSETAVNALGMELEGRSLRECACDAIDELLNVTCGQFLLKMAGKEPVFHLSIPTIKPIDDVIWNNFLFDENTLSFTVDDYPVLVKLVIDESIGG